MDSNNGSKTRVCRDLWDFSVISKVSKPHLGFTSSRRGFNVIFFRASCNFGMLWRTKDGEWSEKDSSTCRRSRAHFPPHFREMDVHLVEGNNFLLLHCRQRHCHTSTRVKTVVNETSWEILFIILRKRHLKVPSRMCREQDKFNNWTTKMNTFDLSNYFLLLIVCKETFMSLLDSFSWPPTLCARISKLTSLKRFSNFRKKKLEIEVCYGSEHSQLNIVLDRNLEMSLGSVITHEISNQHSSSVARLVKLPARVEDETEESFCYSNVELSQAF